MVEGDAFGEFPVDIGCECLAKFNTHLVEAVDVPDDALYEDFVFVECHEGSEGFWPEFVHEDHVAWASSLELFLLDELFDLFCRDALLFHFCPGFGFVPADHEGFCLGKAVCEQELVMAVIGVAWP